MSEGNGVIRIGRKGIVKFEFEGRNGEIVPVEVDIVHMHDYWFGIVQGFRDEKQEIPASRMSEYIEAKAAFVKKMLRDTGTKVPERMAQYDAVADDLSHANALEFHRCMIEEVEKLQSFFVPRIGKGPSPPPSSKPEVTFSE